jgi:DNA-binding NarL/FixJ family response regulator
VDTNHARDEGEDLSWKTELMKEVGAAAGTVATSYGVEVVISTIMKPHEVSAEQAAILDIDRQIFRGMKSCGLTSREQNVAELLVSGHTRNEIARKLFLSEGTVRNYASNILHKTGLRGMGGLAYRLMYLGAMHTDEITDLR